MPHFQIDIGEREPGVNITADKYSVDENDHLHLYDTAANGGKATFARDCWRYVAEAPPASAGPFTDKEK